MKIVVFIKECVEIYSTVLSTDEDPAQVANILQLNDDSRQVSDTVVRYVIHKSKHL